MERAAVLPDRVSLLLAISTIALLTILFLGSSGSEGEISIDSPTTVVDHVIWENEYVSIGEEVRVQDGGVLDIRSSTLVFSGGQPLEAGITVEPGGSLYLGGGGAGCLVTNVEGGHPYHLRAHPDSRVDITNTTISGMGQNYGTTSLWGTGVCFRCDEVRVLNSSFVDCYIGIGLEGSLGNLVSDCTFINCSAGIRMRACSETRVEGSLFTNCTKGLDGDDFFANARMACIMKDCEFNGGRFGVTFNGRGLVVENCTFALHDRAIYCVGVGTVSIHGTRIEESKTGIVLKAVDACDILRSDIQGCLFGMEVEDSRLHVSDCRITTMDVAITGQGAVLSLRGVEIDGSDEGIVMSRTDRWNTLSNTATLDDVAFADVLNPLRVVEALNVDLAACEFAGATTALHFDDVDEITVRGNDVRIERSFIFFERVGSIILGGNTYRGEEVNLRLSATNMSLPSNDSLPEGAEMILEGSSSVQSVISPESFDLIFLDSASVFRWVKEMTVRVLLASSGAPAIGAMVTVTDNGSVMIGEVPVGQSGEVHFGAITIVEVHADGDSCLGPHSVVCRLGGIEQNESVDTHLVEGCSIRVEVLLDDVPPTISIIEPVDGGVYPSPTVNVSGSAEDPQGPVASVSISIDGVLKEVVDPVWETVVEAGAGWHSILVRALDAHGNTESSLIWFRVVEPLGELTVESPDNGTITREVSVRIVGKAPGAEWLRVDSHLVQLDSDGGFGFHRPLEEGVNIFSFVYGTELDQTSSELHVIRDTRAPEIHIAITNILVNTSWYTLNGHIVDDNPSSEVLIGSSDIATVQNGSFAFSMVLSEGLNKIDVSVEDQVGNWNSTSVRIVVDTTILLEVLGNPDLSTTEGTAPLTLRCEKGATLTLIVNGAVGDRYDLENETIFIAVGLPVVGGYNITLHAKDRAGNEVSMVLDIARVMEDPPPEPTWTGVRMFLVALSILLTISILYLLLGHRVKH